MKFLFEQISELWKENLFNASNFIFTIFLEKSSQQNLDSDFKLFFEFVEVNVDCIGNGVNEFDRVRQEIAKRKPSVKSSVISGVTKSIKAAILVFPNEKWETENEFGQST